jgi:hypothetical protein
MMWSCSEALLYGAILLTSFPNSDALASSLLRGAAQRDSNDGTEATPTALPTITTTTPNAPTFPYLYPDYRYTTWQSLDNATKSIAQDARGLRYEENTWNLPYTAPVEMLSWESLRKEQLAGVQIIGFVEEVEAEEVWDCFQNHYEDYDWSELVQCNLSEYFGVLGWTKASWNGEAPPPASENSAKAFHRSIEYSNLANTTV